MSARVSPEVPQRGWRTIPRKMVLNVDLNAPPCENGNEVGTSRHPPVRLEVQVGQQGPPRAPVPIDVESLDDDVILSSPRAFAEAKNNSRRNRGRSNVVDVELESAARQIAGMKRRRVPVNAPIINCESYVDAESKGNAVSGNRKSLPQQPKNTVKPSPPPPPPEPTFNCPVCMGPLVEEMSTKCGHIFCKACIKQSIAAQGKCPTCRRKVTMKDTIRIYLPATNLT